MRRIMCAAILCTVMLIPVQGTAASQEPVQRSGSATEELVKLTASDGTAQDRFGISVSMSGDTAVVGAPHEDVEGRPQQGAAYVFRLVDGSWVEQAKLVASDGGAVDRFGTAVSISGDTVVVGAFWGDVGVNPDQGSAYVFTRSGGAWAEQAKLVASDGAAADNFGFFVDVSGDTALVGAYWDDVGVNVDQGSAYVFTRAEGTWTEQAQLTAADGAARDEFGGRVALAGDTAVVGGNEAVHVFTRAEGTWNEKDKLTASDGAPSDGFGSWVSLSGSTIVVGAMSDEQGSAYVFTRIDGAWIEQAKLKGSDGTAGDLFGRSITVSGDTVVVGAQYDDIDAKTDQGSAYVFTRAGGTWTEQAHLIASDGGAGDLFGVSVAMSGGTALIGAGFADVGDNAVQGAAYMWEEDSASLAITEVTDGPDPFTPSADTRRFTKIGFTVSKGATVTLRIFNRNGRLVRALLESEALTGGRHSVRWNGRNTKGQVVKPGEYEYRLKADDAAGNKRRAKGTVTVR